MKRLVLVATLSGGCVSLNQYQRAETVGQGNAVIGVEPNVIGAYSAGTNFFVPGLTASLNYGVSDTTDFNARLGLWAFEAGFKSMLTERDATTKLSIAPSFGAFGAGGAGGGGGYLMASVPLLIGFDTGGGSQFVLGPKLSPTFVFGAGGGAAAGGLALNAGTTVGYSAVLGESFRIHPEIGFGVPVVGAAAATGGGGNGAAAATGFGAVSYAVGLGFKFGKID